MIKTIHLTKEQISFVNKCKGLDAIKMLTQEIFDQLDIDLTFSLKEE